MKEAEDVKKEAKTSFYLQYMGKEISTEEITKKVHEVWTKEYGKSVVVFFFLFFFLFFVSVYVFF